MKHIKNKIFISLFLLGTTTHVFAMGAKRPSASSSTGILTSVLSSVSKLPVSTYQQPSLTSQLPLPMQLPTVGTIGAVGSAVPALITQMLTTFSPMLTSINPIFGLISPALSIVGQLQSLKSNSSVGRISTTTSTTSTNTSTILSKIVPSAAVTSTQGNAYIDQIESLAIDSACSEYSFVNRGKAPEAFMKGLSLSYARSLCRLQSKSRIFSFISTVGLGNALSNALKDALTNFQSNFTSFGPVTSKELLSIPACNQLLKDINDLVKTDQYACQDIGN